MTLLIKTELLSSFKCVPKNHCGSKNWAPWLLLLLSLFAFRVIAQLLLIRFETPLLPGFENWHSGTMPYWLLLIGQIMILLPMLWVTFCFSQDCVISNPRLGKFLAIVGLAYLAAMLLRLILGLTVYSDSRWFINWISTGFHIVLASFVLTIAAYHLSHWIQSIRFQQIFSVIIYPFVMSSGLALHYALLHGQQNSLVSVYMPIIIGAALVALFELLFPYNQNSQPDKVDIRDDLWFMLIIQMALPQLFAVLFVHTLVNPLQSMEWHFPFQWPHYLPLYSQVIIMLLIADFFRYWLHRVAHKNKFLWRFHAVHHSPKKLYWLNVGRFHPVDKILQLFLDMLPFMLLGVNTEVLDLYLVFYAINGFFQHCNIQLRFGFLNYLISSVELHRWHHSRLREESNSNYGNNLSIWDLLFCTWVLPKDRQVSDLGLENQKYPMRFAAQLKMPFIKELEKIS